MTLPPPDHKLDFSSLSVDLLKHWLCESLKLRVLNIPEPPNSLTEIDVRVAVLFSGGLDSTTLARLAHDLVPSDQGIDLINVAFENPRQVSNDKTLPHLDAKDMYEACPDRKTGRKAFAELKAACPTRHWRFIAVRSKAHLPRLDMKLTYPIGQCFV